MTEVRILGPIEVVVDDVPVTIGSAQLRRLLAALAVNADQVVSTDRLIDIVWADAAPMNATSTLAKSIYKLRSAIGDSRRDDPMLVTQPPGYVLHLDGQLDANQFARRITDARARLSGADPDGALALLDEALALWRGATLDEFASDEFARAEVARLEGLRASALEERGEIELTLGRHAQLVDELPLVIAQYPLRERFRGQLMLALHRAGRHPEALRAFNEFRQLMIDELGLEPSRELQELDRAIAREDPELDWTHSGLLSSESPTRDERELPSGSVTFVFTDIEHSTKMLRRLGGRYPIVLERYREIVRLAVAAQGGVEVNTEGDGMFLAFARASDAIAACVSAQRSLVTTTWPDEADLRVRMGVHTGEAEPLEHDYAALAVHQAARVTSCAYGSQIIASAATIEAATADGSEEGGAAKSLGLVAVRDFDDPIELYQLVHPDLPLEFPPPRQTVDHTSLPALLAADRSSFAGRSADLEWLGALWRRVGDGESCIALVVGPDGSGKSRLVAEFARRAHAAGAVVVQPPDPSDIGTVLASVPGGVPTIVVLEDVTAGDDIAAVLRDAIERRPDIARLVVVTLPAHLEHEDGLAATLADRARLVVRELSGLDRSAVATMLATAGVPPADDLVTAVMAETGGIPSLVAKVADTRRVRAAALRVERALHRAEGARAELQTAEDEIAAGVLTRSRSIDVRDLDDESCPYMGLAHFEEADAAYYFGRERLVATLVTGLSAAPIVGVIGASGGGKSSLVRAGLIPALRRGCLPGSEAWPIHVLRPGADPLGRLQETLGTTSPDDASRRAVESLPVGARMVLVVDQFEELFTLCANDGDRTAFIDALTDIDAHDSPASVVLTLRADYYGSCAAHPALARLLERSQVLVGPLTPSELREVIVEPARYARLAVEPALVDVIVADVAEQPGMLPLVSTALAETWTHRAGDTLTLAAYADAGGVRGSLARLADRGYGSLAPDERDIARRIFLRLAQLGEGMDDVSRRAPRRELGGDAATTAVLSTLIASRLLTAEGDTVEVAHEALLREWPQLRAWLEQDRDGRRLHHQLADAAAQWEADGRDASELYRGVRLSAAIDWASAHDDAINTLEREFLDASTERDHHELRRARRTSRRLRELAGAMAVLLVVALIAGGLAAVQRGNADRAAGRATATARRSDANRLAVLARSLGDDQNDLALLLGLEGHRIEPSVDTEGGLESALVHVPPGVDRIIETGATINQVSITQDGTRAVLARGDGHAELWDLTTGRRVRTLGHSTKPATSVQLSDDDRLVAIGHGNGDVEIVEVTTGAVSGAVFHLGPEPALVLFASTDDTKLVTFNEAPDSNHLAWQGVLWDRADPDHPKRIGGPFVLPLNPGGGERVVAEVSGDHTRLLAGNTLSAPTRVWDLATGAQVGSLPIAALSQSRYGDGSTVAGASGDQIVLVDSRSGKLVGGALPSLGARPGRVTVSRDGSKLAVVSDVLDGKVVVFDVASRSQVGAVTLHTGAAPVEFLRDGRLVITSGSQLLLWRPGVTVPPIGTALGESIGPASAIWSEDGNTVVVFDSIYSLTSNRVFAFDGHTGAAKRPFLPGEGRHAAFQVFPVAPSPDGSMVAIVGADRVVHIRTAKTGADLSILDAHEKGGELGVLWSPTGDRIATIGAGQSLLLWDVSDIRHPRIAAPPLVLPGTPALNPSSLIAVFSRDGRSLLAIDEPRGNLMLFDVRTGASKWSTTEGSFPTPARLGYTSRDELLMASGTRTVSVLDPATGHRRQTLSVPEVGTWIDVLRHGDLIAVDGTERDANGPVGVVRLYDRDTREQIGDPLPVGAIPTKLGDQLVFFQAQGEILSSPDGTRFITSPQGFDQTVVLWDVELSHWRSIACRIAGRNLTKDEWRHYLPDQPYHTTCAQWHAGR